MQDSREIVNLAANIYWTQCLYAANRRQEAFEVVPPRPAGPISRKTARLPYAFARLGLPRLETAPSRVGLEQTMHDLGLQASGLMHPLGGTAGWRRDPWSTS